MKFQRGVFEIHIDQENDTDVKLTISRKMTENPKIFGASRLNKANTVLSRWQGHVLKFGFGPFLGCLKK